METTNNFKNSKELHAQQILSLVQLFAVRKTEFSTKRAKAEQDTIYFKVKDLIFIAGVMLEEGHTFAPVTHDFLKVFNISESEIFLQALKNKGAVRECTIRSSLGSSSIDVYTRRDAIRLVTQLELQDISYLFVTSQCSIVNVIQSSALFNELLKQFPEAYVVLLTTNKCIFLRDKRILDSFLIENSYSKPYIFHLNSFRNLLSGLAANYFNRLDVF